MATATAAAKRPDIKEFNFTWVGQDRAGKTVRGETRAAGEAQVNALLRRQGIKVVQVKRERRGRGGKVTEKDIALFTRQLATMLDWASCMDAIAEMQPDAVLEIGPCNALARMFAEACPGVPIRAIDDFRDPAAASATQRVPDGQGGVLVRGHDDRDRDREESGQAVHVSRRSAAGGRPCSRRAGRTPR